MTVQIGRYPTVTLAKAREDAAVIREKLSRGINPIAEKRLEKARRGISQEATFKFVADELLKVKEKNVSSSYFDKLKGALNANLYPRLGHFLSSDRMPFRITTSSGHSQRCTIGVC